VEQATKLYSQEQEETALVYPTYEASKKRFNKAHKTLQTVVAHANDLDEHTPLETRIDYVKAFQELNNSYDALVTYNEYNDEMEQSYDIQNQVMMIEESIGVYHTIKGSLIDEEDTDEAEADFSAIEFYGENAIKMYDIDSTYIDKLLETYSAGNENIRDDIEKALQKLEKSEIVKQVYRKILNAIDAEEVDVNEDIFMVKRRFFTEYINQAMTAFAHTWFVDERELHLSAMQYAIGTDPIPNIGGIIDSTDFAKYKVLHPNAKPFTYGPKLKREWGKVLDEVVVPLEDELR
jgi:type I restriction enzyme R subunit